MIIFDFQNTFKNSQKLNPFFYDLSYGIFFNYFQHTILTIFFGTMITFLGVFPAS